MWSVTRRHNPRHFALISPARFHFRFIHGVFYSIDCLFGVRSPEAATTREKRAGNSLRRRWEVIQRANAYNREWLVVP